MFKLNSKLKLTFKPTFIKKHLFYKNNNIPFLYFIQSNKIFYKNNFNFHKENKIFKSKFNFNFSNQKIYFSNSKSKIKTINVPFMGDSIVEGKLLEFSKNEGDFVKEDEVVALIETDKTSLEIRSPEDGKLEKFMVNVEDMVKVDSPLYKLNTSVENNQKPTENKNKNLNLNVNLIKPNETIAQKPIKTEKLNKNKNNPFETSKTKIDEQIKQNSNFVNESVDRKERKITMSRMRIKIAERLKESQNTAASLTTFNQIDCSEILRIKNEYKQKFLDQTESKLGLMSSFIKASSLALTRFPEVNAEFNLNQNCIIMKDYTDISVAVASPKGLVVPVLRNVEKMNFSQIEKEISKFATMAKNETIKLEDMQGGTFTVSNSGVFKSLLGTPIINPPQSAVLGMYGIFDTPVAINKKVEIRKIMKVALTYDHRAIDGREAMMFLRAIKEYIENPLTMLFW